MRSTRINLTALLLFLLALSCERHPTPIEQKIPRITLTVEEVAVTEAWLRLQADNAPQSAMFKLLRNDSITHHGPLTTNDTLLYDDGLLPNHSYCYSAILQKDEKKVGESQTVMVQSMDTTSHEFSWDSFADRARPWLA